MNETDLRQSSSRSLSLVLGVSPRMYKLVLDNCSEAVVVDELLGLLLLLAPPLPALPPPPPPPPPPLPPLPLPLLLVLLLLPLLPNDAELL
jgi:hypothetical protein